MDIRRIRMEMRQGKSIFDLPLRVTFYARVSTDQEEQLNSLENQVQYYTELIRGRKNWTFVPGYVDEGISGTGTKKRDRFNRMIQDARAGLFDFVITKEISRFSRSTLDSIQYTQELLNYNVGVLFQNDNINTLDTDSELRLVIMAGVAQDEVRKLSERLKFGFRQAIRNGHVLGNDGLYGYDKKDCVLTIREEEAEIVRIIYDRYANHGDGIRKISQKLTEMGYTSRRGNAFNVLTVRHILENPKYKGWYCGNKTQTLDYRTGKKAVLNESEWVTYPDPGIPAIVSEELWNRANAIYRARRQKVLTGSGTSYHNRYAYSGKIFCEEHGTVFHRQTRGSAGDVKEVWLCRVYRQRGKEGCAAPQVRSQELDWILAWIFKRILQDPKAVTDALAAVLTQGTEEEGKEAKRRFLEGQIAAAGQKKERLLELQMAGAITLAEFKERNDALNDRLKELRARLETLPEKNEGPDRDGILRELERILESGEAADPRLGAALLQKAVVRRESRKERISLDIYLKTGHKFTAVCRLRGAEKKTSPMYKIHIAEWGNPV